MGRSVACQPLYRGTETKGGARLDSGAYPAGRAGHGTTAVSSAASDSSDSGSLTACTIVRDGSRTLDRESVWFNLW